MSSSRKVLVVTDSLALGGTERQLNLFIKYLPSTWEARVWSLSDGPFAPEIKKTHTPLYVRPRRWRWDLKPALDLWHQISVFKPDIIHSYGYMSSLAAIWPAKWFKIPLIDNTIRQSRVPSRRGWLWRQSLRWADRIISNSQAGLEAFDIPPSKGRVIFNGFDPERWKYLENHDGPNAAPFKVVMVARMSPMKDFKTFLEAAKKIQNNNGDNWLFLAIGTGPERDSLMKIAQNPINQNRVAFPDPSLEILPIIRDANVGVLMTSKIIDEGCSNAIMEYMACGLPVICSDSGGNRELVIDGKTGFIIPKEDHLTLAKCLLRLHKDQAMARQMGKIGREIIRKDFSVQRMVDRTLKVYNEVLARA